MPDNPKNNSINLNNVNTVGDLEELLDQLKGKDNLQSALRSAEKNIYQKHLAPIEDLDKSVEQTKVQIEKLDKRMSNLAANLEKLYNSMSRNEEVFGKASEQYLDVAESFKEVGKKAKETADRLNYAESYVETAQDLIDHTAKVIVEANRKFQKDKEEISRDMSDITRDVSDQIVLARQNMIQLGRLFEQDRERYAEDYLKSINTWSEAQKQRDEVEKIQWKYMSTQERQNAMHRASTNYLEKKKDLDMRRDTGELSQENYGILLAELRKGFAGHMSLEGLLGGKLAGLTEGKPLKDILNSGILNALSVSPVGQAVLAISNYVGKIFSVLNSGVQASSNMAKQYLGKIDARLQSSMVLDPGEAGFGIYKKINADLLQRFVASPFVSQKDLMQSISQFVDNGVAWNVEQRALIATLSDKMVTTFNALDASLTRLIRIQGADLTMSSMGAEAQLTKFLNKNFEDTSYLNSLYDTVNSAVLDASAQLNYEGAIGFNYAVQKWLGSLYSVGMSESGVQTIAQGLNYLATGNAEALAGNSSLQNLLALSATNAGLNYADLLSTGLNADKTDMLLESMVRYLQGIYSNIGNNVVKSAWSNISGLGVSDLRAISNLSQTEIANIAGNDISYSNAINEFKYQLSRVEERTSSAEYATNLIDNILINLGNTVLGNNDSGTGGTSGLSSYLLWQLGEKMGGLAGTLTQGLSIGMDLFDGGNSIFNLAASMVGAVTGGSLNLEKGFENVWKPNNFDSGIFGSQITLKDRALNYVPLLQMIASSDTKDLTTSGTDLGTLVGSGARAVQNALRAATSSSSAPFSEGTSFAMTNASTASARNMSLSANDVVTAEVSNVTGTEGELATKTVYDLYVKLFETRDVPIRVQLAEFEALATKSLKESLIDGMANDLKYLANQASGSGINVDIGSEDAAVLTSQIYNVRRM